MAVRAESRRPPAILAVAAGVVLAASASQLAWALHPRKGPFIGYSELLACLVLAAWAIAVLRRRFAGVAWPPWPAWAWLAAAIISLSAATSIKAGLVEIAQLALYFVALYAFFAEAFRGREEWAASALAAGVAICAATAWLDLFTAGDPMQVRGLFANRNIYSAYMAFALPLLWAWACAEMNRIQGKLAALGVFLATATLLGPPHVYIALGAILAVSAKLLGRRAAPIAGLFAAGVIAVQLASPIHRACNISEWSNPWETGNVYKLLKDAGASTDVPLVKKRWLEWYPALAMIADRPVFGVGAGNFQLNIGRPEYWGGLPNVKKSEPDTNNMYLVIGGSMGLPGLVALLALLIGFLREAGGAAARAGRKRELWLATGVAASLAALAAAALFTSVFVRGAAIAWAALLALTRNLAAETAPEPVVPKG